MMSRKNEKRPRSKYVELLPAPNDKMGHGIYYAHLPGDVFKVDRVLPPGYHPRPTWVVLSRDGHEIVEVSPEFFKPYRKDPAKTQFLSRCAR